MKYVRKYNEEIELNPKKLYNKYKENKLNAKFLESIKSLNIDLCQLDVRKASEYYVDFEYLLSKDKIKKLNLKLPEDRIESIKIYFTAHLLTTGTKSGHILLEFTHMLLTGSWPTDIHEKISRISSVRDIFRYENIQIGITNDGITYLFVGHTQPRYTCSEKFAENIDLSKKELIESINSSIVGIPNMISNLEVAIKERQVELQKKHNKAKDLEQKKLSFTKDSSIEEYFTELIDLSSNSAIDTSASTSSDYQMKLTLDIDGIDPIQQSKSTSASRFSSTVRFSEAHLNINDAFFKVIAAIKKAKQRIETDYPVVISAEFQQNKVVIKVKVINNEA